MIYPYSDHDLVRVLLTVDKASSNVGPGVWKLNVSLLQVQEVREQIASFWEHWKDRKSDFSNVAEWWDSGKLRVKSLFLKYSHKESRKRKQERATVLNRYRRIVCKTNLSEDEVKELDLVKSQLETMDLKRTQGNKIRSGAKWLESNEQPSRFFFQKEKRRAVKKTCHALRTSDGRRVTEQDDISKEQVRFYKELYSKVPTDKVAQDRLLNLLDRKLTNEQRDSCEGQLTVGECLVAVKSMANGKTPCSDGLPKEFYLSFWDLLKEDFVEIANYCFSIELMPESIRQALISLLFKKEDPELLKNWRPISLLNTDYKIITKVLVNRVKPVMPMIIHPDQCCSVPGRSSEDNATLLRDVCDYLEVNEIMACAFISIDQEK
jgi:hypothetical protein